MVELTNTMGILEHMESGVYRVVETQWNINCPILCKFIKQTIKQRDKYARITFTSNMDEKYLTSWKPVGKMLGVSGSCTYRVHSTSNNSMGRYTWINLRGEHGRMIRVISAYRVSQDSPEAAGEPTSCKQEV